MRLVWIGAAALGLAGCAGNAGEVEASADMPEPIKRPVEAACDAAFAQHHLGETVTQELGLAIREETGAESLRWGPPNTVWTMDYRETRVNIRYDTDMKITAITCG